MVTHVQLKGVSFTSIKRYTLYGINYSSTGVTALLNKVSFE